MSKTKTVKIKFITIKLRDPFFAKSVLERLRKMPDVVAVDQVFPGNVDVHYQKMCVMKVKSSALEEVLAKLLRDKDLEAAYEAPIRRLFN